MPTSEPLTIGEIARTLERIERGTEGIHQKLDARPTREELARVEKQLRAEVDELHDSQTWLYRLTIGAVVTALIGLVVGVDSLPIP